MFHAIKASVNKEYSDGQLSSCLVVMRKFLIRSMSENLCNNIAEDSMRVCPCRFPLVAIPSDWSGFSPQLHSSCRISRRNWSPCVSSCRGVAVQHSSICSTPWHGFDQSIRVLIDWIPNSIFVALYKQFDSMISVSPNNHHGLEFWGAGFNNWNTTNKIWPKD